MMTLAPQISQPTTFCGVRAAMRAPRIATETNVVTTRPANSASPAAPDDSRVGPRGAPPRMRSERASPQQAPVSAHDDQATRAAGRGRIRLALPGAQYTPSRRALEGGPAWARWGTVGHGAGPRGRACRRGSPSPLHPQSEPHLNLQINPWGDAAPPK